MVLRPGSRVLVVALVVAGCTAHRQPNEHESEACPDSRLLDTIEGRWKVGYAIYHDGQKPPEPRRLGELVIEGCEFRFVVSEAAELQPELRAAAAEIPLVERRHGTVEVLGEWPDDASARWSMLGALRFRTTWFSHWDVTVRRIGPGYFYMWPFEPERFHGNIERGTREWFPDEIPPSSDPETPAPPELRKRLQQSSDP